MKNLLRAALILAFAASHALADLYSWTDRNGVKHFSNEPPPRGEEVTGLIVVKETAEPEPEPAAAAEAPAAADSTSQGKPSKTIEVFIEPNSAACKQAMAFFNQNKTPYSVHDITVSAQQRQRYESLRGTTLPLVLIGDQRIDGWNEGRARALLAQP